MNRNVLRLHPFVSVLLSSLLAACAAAPAARMTQTTPTDAASAMTTPPAESATTPECNTITFMAAEYSPGTLAYWQNLARDFEVANPGTKVNIEIVNWQQIHNITAQRIAANKLPDLVNTATIWLPEWVESGAIQPIDPVLTPELKSRFFESMLEKAALYDGKNWGLPIAAGVRGLYWNKDLFEKAGLDPEKPPRTWDELYQAVTTIKDKTGEFGFSFDGKGVQAFRSFGYFLWNSGGDFFTPDGKAAFNSPEGVQALAFMVKLVESGAVPDPTGVTIEGDEEPMFVAGKSAMIMTGTWLVGLVKKGSPNMRLGVTHVPVRDPNFDPVNWGVTDTLIMSKDACVPVAGRFIEFMYMPEHRVAFSKEIGDLPVTKDAAADPYFANDPLNKQFIALLPTARFDPLHPKYSKMQEILKVQLQLAYKGQKSAQQALEDAAAEFNALK
jgi:multiple sugar transport system substrate-binding protein